MGKILNQTPTMGMARKTGVAKDWVMYPQQLILHRNFCIMGISRRNHQLRRLNQICMPPLHHLQETKKKKIKVAETGRRSMTYRRRQRRFQVRF